MSAPPGRWRAFASAFPLLLLAAPAGAQIPLGPEFRVDTRGAVQFGGTGFGFTCDAALAGDGQFVVAWTASPAYPNLDQVARRFDAHGRAVGLEFTVNTYTTNGQGNGTVAVDDAGNFVVAWNSSGQGGPGYRSLGQRFAASGAPIGGEISLAQTGSTRAPAVAMQPDRGFVVAWWSSSTIMARLFDPSGAPIGAEFRVNTSPYATSMLSPSVDVDDAGNFVVVWEGAGPSGNWTALGQRFFANGSRRGSEFAVSPATATANTPRVAMSADGRFAVTWYDLNAWPQTGAWVRRYDAAGAPIGPEFLANSYTTASARAPDIDMDADGDFVVAWHDSSGGVFARRFDANGAGTGPEFRVDAATTGDHSYPSVAVDRAGNFVIAWHSRPAGDQVLARRYAGGLMAAALAVDASASPTSDGNGVLEAGETVTVAPTWLNANALPQAFTGAASTFTGPGTGGNPTYTIADNAASYGTVASGATGGCASGADCYALGISLPNPRPALHWDASFREDIAPANLGASKTWTLHVGDSFSDVSPANPFYRFVETLLHHGVTAGCSASTYCPGAATSREQMAVFVLAAREGAGYVPPACVTPPFADVPTSSPFCRWVAELAARGVVGGCGGGNYCPGAVVTREQMAAFVVRTLDPSLSPPPCGTPVFSDVPASSPFCPWIEELARRGVVSGCGGGSYCPGAVVTREQMAVFMSVTFGLLLYGP